MVSVRSHLIKKTEGFGRDLLPGAISLFFLIRRHCFPPFCHYYFDIPFRLTVECIAQIIDNEQESTMERIKADGARRSQSRNSFVSQMRYADEDHSLFDQLWPKLRPFQREAVEYATQGKPYRNYKSNGHCPASKQTPSSKKIKQQLHNRSNNVDGSGPQGRILLADGRWRMTNQEKRGDPGFHACYIPISNHLSPLNVSFTSLFHCRRKKWA